MKYKFEFIAFTTGLLIMCIELVGSRLLAPHLGTSIFVWTSIIGIVLTSLSFGYYWGGKISNRQPDISVLLKIILTAAIFSSTILIVERFVPLLVYLPIDQRIITILACILLFAPVTIYLGMVTPYVARLKINSLDTVGSDIGNLYSVSTIGSIIGTFLGGFVLISYFGTRIIFIFVTFGLFLLYLFVALISHKKIFSLRFFIFICTALLMLVAYYSHTNSTVIADIDSEYNRWIVSEYQTADTDEPIRVLMNGIGGQQSGISLKDPTKLIFPYLKQFSNAELINPSFQKVLLVGAGGYTYPTYFTNKYPKKQIDIIEIDPIVKDIAKSYFFYKDTPQVSHLYEDGRMFLNRNTNKYDIIFVDAFSSQNVIPYQLTTVEAIEKIKNAVTDSGLVVVNIISSIEGEKSDFLKAEYKTYRTLFPNVNLFQVNPGVDTNSLQNIILVASKSSAVDMSVFGMHIGSSSLESNLPLLTDDFAPVEYYAVK